MAHKCCTKQKVKRGLWSPEEDHRLLAFLSRNAHASWSSVPRLAGLQRCGKSCRLRWMNYLRPEVKRGTFTSEEEQIIIDVHRMLGNRWSEIARHLPGRTDNEVKNYWNSSIKKKLAAHGLDPQTHTLFKPNKSAKRPRRPNSLKLGAHISYVAVDDEGTQSLPPQRQHARGLEKDVDRVVSHVEESIDGHDNSCPSTSCVGLMMESVGEGWFGNYGFEVDMVDDGSCMDDLLWNSISAFPA